MFNTEFPLVLQESENYATHCEALSPLQLDWPSGLTPTFDGKEVCQFTLPTPPFLQDGMPLFQLSYQFDDCGIKNLSDDNGHLGSVWAETHPGGAKEIIDSEPFSHSPTASRNGELTLEVSELRRKNEELSARNAELCSEICKLRRENVDLARKNEVFLRENLWRRRNEEECFRENTSLFNIIKGSENSNYRLASENARLKSQQFLLQQESTALRAEVAELNQLMWQLECGNAQSADAENFVARGAYGEQLRWIERTIADANIPTSLKIFRIRTILGDNAPQKSQMQRAVPKKSAAKPYFRRNTSQRTALRNSQPEPNQAFRSIDGRFSSAVNSHGFQTSAGSYSSQSSTNSGGWMAGRYKNFFA
ncbi:MAG: hypothetical protein LBI61_00730 [Puniceicoccales bacterium]|jgi:cell division protein FtsB|nr:hypothetical protein [Puniceicoccales bacterium]